jgi:hypothetical protein
MKMPREVPPQHPSKSVHHLMVGTIAFQASQVLEYLRNGCLKTADPVPDLRKPPPIILPYFGVIRIADKHINTRPILETDFNPKPQTVALHPPPPAPTMPQVQDDFYAMNMESGGSFMDQPFGSPAPFNWDFNFAIDPGVVAAQSGQVGGMPMDIEAWSSVSFLGKEVLIGVVLECFE